MANRCGIRRRYPIKILILDDDGGGIDGPDLGDAETLAEAIAIVERCGLHPRDAEDGGRIGFVGPIAGGSQTAHFLITVYPEP